MTAFLLVLAVLSLAGVAASVHLVRTDGYGPVPDCRSTGPDRRASASETPASRSQPLRRAERGWNRDANAAQTR